MTSDPGRRREVVRYYELAPLIVTEINNRPGRSSLYDSIYERHLVPAIAAIDAGDCARAHALYKSMVLDLERRILEAPVGAD